ncbi:MAG: 5'-nucleotidase C-terminal domain-containing protein [Candidatus Izemoplasmataceae bacterium]
MKKAFLFVCALCIGLTLVGCEDVEVPTLDAFDELEATVEDNNTALLDSLSDLEDELSSLEASLTELDGDYTEVSDAIAEIRDYIDDMEVDFPAYQDEVADDFAAQNDLIEALQLEVDALNAMIASLQLEVDALDAQLNPIFTIPSNTTEIVIAHTNDVHGRVNADSYAGSMGMATIKNIVDQLRSQFDNTFLVDAGDILHGTTFATLEEGESVLNVMNQVGYDLMVPGNHDFNYGQDRLLELEALAEFPMISANIQYAEDDTDFMNPYFIQDFNGVKVGFFGLTSPETVYKTHPDNVTGLNFLDPIVQATAMVEELEPLTDIIILLGHIGLDEDTLITSEDIANAVDGIDVIIDGHSHSTLPEGIMVNNTLIVSTGEYMKNLGVFSITVQYGEIVEYKVMLIDADEAEELNFGDDQVVQDFIDAIIAEQDVILNEVVGQTGVTLNGVRNYVRSGETNLGNLITDSMLNVTGADVAITNGGGIRTSIEEGDVTLGDIISVLPFGNIIATIELTGQEILDSLEYGTSSYPSPSGKFPHVAGMTFEIDYSAEAGSRVTNLMIDGVAVDLGATYVVATNDFMAAGGDGYDIFATKPIVGEFMGLHEALESMFTVGVDVELPTMGRITVTNYMDVFFSEYVEGTSNNKALELYNPTDAAILLDGYVINYYNNGAGAGEPTKTFDLSGITLEAGEVYVICTDTYAGPAVCDEIQAYADEDSVVFFNGDDAIELMKDGVPIDTIGLVGQEGDDGEEWVVESVDPLGDPIVGATNEFTLVRASSITGPSRLFDPTEWVVHPQDTFDELGTHTTD